MGFFRAAIAAHIHGYSSETGLRNRSHLIAPSIPRLWKAVDHRYEWAAALDGWMPIFLPSLWLFALYVNDAAAAAIGLLWILGRILYLKGYSEAADKRRTGFGIQALAAGVLFFGAFGGIIARFVAAS